MGARSGRKTGGDNRQKRGPGKRAKRQQDAVIPKSVLIADGIIDPVKKKSRQQKKNKVQSKRRAEDLLTEKEDVKAEVKSVDENKNVEEAVQEIIPKKKLKMGDDSSDEELPDDDFDLDSEENEEEEVAVDQELLEEMQGESEESETQADDSVPYLERKKSKQKQLDEDADEDADPEAEIHIDTLTELPTAEELENNNLTDAEVLKDRINRNITTLDKFTLRRNPKYSRSEYLTVLVSDLCSLYGYNEFLMNKFIQLLPMNELIDFLDANEKQRPIVIRTNTLKSRRRELAQALIARGVNLDPLETKGQKWSNTGLTIHESGVPIGATPEYLTGHYMLQGASSQLPVISLAPKPGDKVLDCSAAPGGKTTHMAAMMRNSGILVANDANKDRAKSLIANLHRLNCCNAIVSHMDGRDLSKSWKHYFNKILLDAPCSGTGVIAKDPQVKCSKDDADIKRCACLQKEILLSAVDCLNANSKEGAEMVYCTCSLMVEENEDVVDYILRKRHVKVVETGLPFGDPGFTKYGNKKYDESIRHTRRYYPHKHNVDGFFVCKLVKTANGEKKNDYEIEEEKAVKEQQKQKAKAKSAKKKLAENAMDTTEKDSDLEDDKKSKKPTTKSKNQKAKSKKFFDRKKKQNQNKKKREDKSD